MLQLSLAIAAAILIVAGNAAAEPSVTIDELCARARAEFKVKSDAFAALEKAKNGSGRSQPVEKPPVYDWACHGAPHYQQRDEQQDADTSHYVEKVFLAKELKSATELLTAVHRVQAACDDDMPSATQYAQERIGRYLRARIEAAARDAMAMPEAEKSKRLWPLIRAIIEFERRQQLLGVPSVGEGEGNLVVAPLVRAHFYAYERLLREQHDLRVTPQIMIQLLKGVESVTDQPEDPLDLVKRLWRFEVDLSNTFSFHEGEDELRDVVIESALRNHVMALRRSGATKSGLHSQVVHFDPSKVQIRNQRVEYQGAQFLGPPSFPSIIDLGFDPCAETPAAYFAITDFASEADTVLEPGGDPPRQEIASPAYYLAPEVMEPKREPAQWNGLPGLVFKLQLRDQSAEVANEKISATKRREDGATISDELKVVIRHAPLGAPTR